MLWIFFIQLCNDLWYIILFFCFFITGTKYTHIVLDLLLRWKINYPWRRTLPNEKQPDQECFRGEDTLEMRLDSGPTSIENSDDRRFDPWAQTCLQEIMYFKEVVTSSNGLDIKVWRTNNVFGTCSFSKLILIKVTKF